MENMKTANTPLVAFFGRTGSLDGEWELWKANSTLLYDFIMSNMTQWPVRCIQWLPDVIGEERNGFATHKLMVGTHSTTGSNYLLVLEFKIPSQSVEFEDALYREDHEDFDGFGYRGPIKVEKQIRQDGHVNRARYMPQSCNIVALKTSLKDVLIYDLKMHSSYSDSTVQTSPELRLSGHKWEGYGLSWNAILRGYLVSSSIDQTICVWDINATPDVNGFLQAKTTYCGHQGAVSDVSWHYFYETIFGSVADDRKMMIWDIRNRQTATPVQIVNAHSAEVNCISFNPLSEYLIATGASDSTVALWDMRNLGKKLHSIRSHNDEIQQVQWSPHEHTILATAGIDRRLHVVNIAGLSGDTIKPQPPNVTFIHSGHTDKILDFSWNVNEPWVLSTVAEDRYLQIWRMNEQFHTLESQGSK